MSNVAKVCKLPGFRYFVFPKSPIAPRAAPAPAMSITPSQDVTTTPLQPLTEQLPQAEAPPSPAMEHAVPAIFADPVEADPILESPVMADVSAPPLPRAPRPSVVSPSARLPDAGFALFDDISRMALRHPGVTARAAPRRPAPEPKPQGHADGAAPFALLSEVNAEIARRRPGQAPGRTLGSPPDRQS